VKKVQAELKSGLSDQEFGKKLLYNLEEAGAILSLSSWTVRDYVKTGLIKAAKVPHPFNPQKLLSRPILIHREELESFARRCRNPEVA
jgi:hypothetical protein